jgi:hypothetical protein
MTRSRRMSAHKRLRARRKVEQAELLRVTSPAELAETLRPWPIATPHLGDPR